MEKMNIDKSKVKEATEALLKLTKIKHESDAELLSDEHPIQLIVGFQKVPSVKDKKIKINLPHSLVTSTTSICLFCKDLTKKGSDAEESKSHNEEQLESHGVTDVEVIPLKTLKLEYIPYEAKKNLSNMYDVFLADVRIMHLLPSFLGKHFYGRKRVPKAVNMEAKDLKKEIDHVLSTCQFEISGRGSTCTAQIGHTALSAQAIVDNVCAAIEKIGDKLPGGVENIRCLHLKTPDSPALTIHWSTESPNNIEFAEKKESLKLDPAEDVTTVMTGKVRVLRDGTIQILNKKTKKLYNEKGELKHSARKRYSKGKKNMDVKKQLRKKKNLNKNGEQAKVEANESQKQLEAIKSKRKASDVLEIVQPTKKTKAEKVEKTNSENHKKSEKSHQKHTKQDTKSEVVDKKNEKVNISSPPTKITKNIGKTKKEKLTKTDKKSSGVEKKLKNSVNLKDSKKSKGKTPPKKQIKNK